MSSQIRRKKNKNRTLSANRQDRKKGVAMNLFFQPASIVITYVVLAVIGVFVGVVFNWFALETMRDSAPSRHGYDKVSSPTVAVGQQLTEGGMVFMNKLPQLAPDITWDIAKPDTLSGKVGSGGYSRTGFGTSAITLIPGRTSIEDELIQAGWLAENDIVAGGPGSILRGYVKTENGKQHLITITYHSKARIISNADEPLKFADCPCPYEIIVSYSEQ